MSPNARRSTSPLVLFTFLAGALTAGIAVALSYQGLHWILSYLVAVNLSTVAAYGYDKLVAGGRALRVPEKTLHLLAFLGGTPGALVAQRLFRHKTVKRPFRVAFWTLTVVQIAVLAWALWYFRLRG